MNILITSAGRRTSLLEHFKPPVHERGGRVFAGDVDPLAPCVYTADEGFQLPPVTNGDYVARLAELAKQHQIRLLIPTIDTELGVLAAHAHELLAEGCTALISGNELIRVAGDKWSTVRHFGDLGFRVPQSWLPDSLPNDLPRTVFLKPRNGSASKNAKAIDRDEMTSLLKRIERPMVQENVVGDEITIDCLFSLDGEPLHYVPRLRIRTLSGESIQGVTLDDEGFRTWLHRLLDELSRLGARGPLTLQAFLTDDSEEPLLSEINPRFGGGFPLAAAAGAPYGEWILQMVEGKKVTAKLGEYVRNRYMTRSYSEIFTDELPW